MPRNPVRPANVFCSATRAGDAAARQLGYPRCRDGHHAPVRAGLVPAHNNKPRRGMRQGSRNCSVLNPLGPETVLVGAEPQHSSLK